MGSRVGRNGAGVAGQSLFRTGHNRCSVIVQPPLGQCRMPVLFSAALCPRHGYDPSLYAVWTGCFC
jgi:hypothetical protein